MKGTYVNDGSPVDTADFRPKLSYNFENTPIRRIADIVNETAINHGFAATANDVDRALLLTIGELVEAQNELREGHSITEVYFNGEKPEGFVIELADAVIRIFNLAAGHGLDIQKAIEVKASYNETRPFKHGKQF
jgi:hypothetical protein